MIAYNKIGTRITLSTQTNINFENKNYFLFINMTHSGLLTQRKQLNYSKTHKNLQLSRDLKDTPTYTYKKNDNNFRIKYTLLTLNI